MNTTIDTADLAIADMFIDRTHRELRSVRASQTFGGQSADGDVFQTGTGAVAVGTKRPGFERRSALRHGLE